MISIPSDKIFAAHYATGWNMCLWGPPKVEIICGSCYREFSTRKYHPYYENGCRTATLANCPSCGMWNKFGMHQT